MALLIYVMHLKLQLHQRNYISGAERRIIQPYPIVGITHGNKKLLNWALPWHTQVTGAYYGISLSESMQ